MWNAWATSEWDNNVHLVSLFVFFCALNKQDSVLLRLRIVQVSSFLWSLIKYLCNRWDISKKRRKGRRIVTKKIEYINQKNKNEENVRKNWQSGSKERKKKFEKCVGENSLWKISIIEINPTFSIHFYIRLFLKL